eukprot:PITA_07363
MLYLGYIIGVDRVRVHEEKIRAIREWPEPSNVMELRGFIGICTYYRKFVKGFSQLATPLTDLTRKGAFSWLDTAQRAFDRLKHVMRSCPVLALPDFTQPFVLECDASGEGIGVVLMQGGHPIAFESQKLLPHVRLYSIYDKEMLAIMHALAKYRQYLVGNKFKVANDRYRVVDEIIYYRDRIFLTEGSQLQKKILQASHDSPLAGHQGFTKTYRAIRERFSWKGLKEDVLQHIRECDVCQRNKGEMSHPTGLLQPLPISEEKWESISMDFITELPMVQGKDCIFVVVDRLTKYAHFFAISAHYTATQVAKLFFREIFRLHGLPKTIVNDRDNRFMGGFWQELFRLVGTKLTPSTSYHPQTDGQTEIVNKWLEGYLHNHVNGEQRAWLKWLHLGEYCYNTSHHMSIGMSPFYALYGYHPLSFADMMFTDSKAPRAKIWIQESQDILRALKDNMATAQNQQKLYADRGRVERQFEVGDMVYLRLQPYRQSSLKKKGAEKLKPHFYGSHRVIRRVGQVAYELELPQGSKIHNAFHISCLKKALGQQVTVTDELPPMDDDGHLVYDEGHLVLQPEAIIDTRERQLRSRTVREFLVRWKNLSNEDDTWESEKILQHPSLQLFEDKKNFAGGDYNIPN